MATVGAPLIYTGGPVFSYDSVNDILNSTRVRIMDDLPTLQAISGALLDRSQPWCQQAVNLTWRRLQECLTDRGYVRLESEAIVQLPGMESLDTASVVVLSWSSNPALPGDLITPLKLWERPTATGGSFLFGEMDKCPNGLPSTKKTQWNVNWSWESDTIRLPGATIATDIRIRYAAFLPDFVDNGTTPWFTLPVQINRCMDAFSLFLCAEVAAAAKQPEMAAALIADAEDKCKQIADRETVKARIPRKQSEYGRMKDARTPTEAA